MNFDALYKMMTMALVNIYAVQTLLLDKGYIQEDELNSYIDQVENEIYQ